MTALGPKDFDELFRAMPEESQEAVLREVAKYIPNPGSPSAVDRGCTCPVYDNAHGAGMGRDEHGQTVYVMSEDCPLHGAPYKRNCGTEIAATATD